ncbi:MAG: hypothetical protein EA422_12130 [Gemmatimonadales bacterium]|nr:MAG: hypothetical protein EA422_12130 [Gemmatimonadales bacterium]
MPRVSRFPHSLIITKALYLGLVTLALVVAAAGHPHPGRGFAVELGVGIGFVGFVMLACQFALTAKFRWLSRVVGLDDLLHFHRQIGFASLVFIVLHVGILLAAQPEYVRYLDPRVNIPRALALWTVLLALATLLVTTVRRTELGLSYEWWRLGHGLLAFLILFIGLVHILQVGWYVATPAKQAFWIGGTLLAVGLLVWTRLVKPFRTRRRPWTVTEVRRERGRSWTLALEPRGHEGISFHPGQFVWLAIEDSPLLHIQHPFSIASAATEAPDIELTIKELGDHTSRIGEVEPGTSAFLDGPFGDFVLDDNAEEAVFIVGGVGITPVMSILRTLRREGATLPRTLIYGVPRVDEATFLDELEEEATTHESIVPVVEDPPAHWQGEAGRVTPELLDRHLPRDHAGVRYFVCGPEPMMDVVEGHLRRRDIPLSRTYSERFNIA